LGLACVVLASVVESKGINLNAHKNDVAVKQWEPTCTAFLKNVSQAHLILKRLDMFAKMDVDHKKSINKQKTAYAYLEDVMIAESIHMEAAEQLKTFL